MCGSTCNRRRTLRAGDSPFKGQVERVRPSTVLNVGGRSSSTFCGTFLAHNTNDRLSRRAGLLLNAWQALRICNPAPNAKCIYENRGSEELPGTQWTVRASGMEKLESFFR